MKQSRTFPLFCGLTKTQFHLFWHTANMTSVQSFEASVRLAQALTEHNVPHKYIICEHSGHGLQNDNKEFLLYNQKMEEYLDKYMPVK